MYNDIYEIEVCIYLNDEKVDFIKIILLFRLVLYIVIWKFLCWDYFIINKYIIRYLLFLNWLLVIYILFLRENLYWKNSIKY